MKLTYTALCIALISSGAYAGETLPVPRIATNPVPPPATRCPPASTQPPPAAVTQPPSAHPRRTADKPPLVERNQDEKYILGKPMKPKPVDEPPPPPCPR